MNVEITKYGDRYWAVWLDGKLLAVVVYKKGARAIGETITKLTTREPATDDS